MPTMSINVTGVTNLFCKLFKKGHIEPTPCMTFPIIGWIIIARKISGEISHSENGFLILHFTPFQKNPYNFYRITPRTLIYNRFTDAFLKMMVDFGC
jgi:hypothetical protein